jgi:hypothetical protein
MSRLFRAVFSLALAGVFTHCATSSGAGGSPASGLRFAWPEGLTLEVSSISTETRDDQPPASLGIDYRLRLEGQGEERKLITDQMRPTGPEASSVEGVAPSLPTLVLGPKGELLRMEGIDPIVQHLIQDAERQGVPKQQMEHFPRMMRDGLERSTRSLWEGLIGKWNGLALKPGESIERTSQARVPRFGSSAATREKVSLKERVPCAEGEAEKRCVRLVVESTLDPGGLEQAMDALLRRLSSASHGHLGLSDETIPHLRVMKLRVDSTLEFIAEQETLVPHLLRTVTISQVVLQAPEGEPQHFERRLELLERFTPVSR